MYTIGPLRVDLDGHYVFIDDTEVHMSATEMRLLANLIAHRGRVRSAPQLLAEVWGYQPGTPTRTLQTHVKRLRDKLGRAATMIETIRGAGYRLTDARLLEGT